MTHRISTEQAAALLAEAEKGDFEPIPEYATQCDALADLIEARAQNEALRAFVAHVVEMEGDAYLDGHPEWPVIVDYARAALAKVSS